MFCVSSSPAGRPWGGVKQLTPNSSSGPQVMYDVAQSSPELHGGLGISGINCRSIIQPKVLDLNPLIFTTFPPFNTKNKSEFKKIMGQEIKIWSKLIKIFMRQFIEIWPKFIKILSYKYSRYGQNWSRFYATINQDMVAID